MLNHPHVPHGTQEVRLADGGGSRRGRRLALDGDAVDPLLQERGIGAGHGPVVDVLEDGRHDLIQGQLRVLASLPAWLAAVLVAPRRVAGAVPGLRPVLVGEHAQVLHAFRGGKGLGHAQRREAKEGHGLLVQCVV